MRYIAYTTKGLEQICQKEILDTLSATIVETHDKRIVFETDVSYETLLQLKTVDDLGLLIATKENVTSLNDIVELLTTIDLLEIKKTLASFREIENEFSITVSIAKAKTIKPQEVISAIYNLVSENYQWKFSEFNHQNFDIRIFIDETHAYISTRVSQESLHHRDYKTETQSGSLRPTVAAAMILLATKDKQNVHIVDTFCGGGTILLEAVHMGYDISGSDIDPESILITKKNLQNLAYKNEETIRRMDATKTNWQTHSFDVAISNLPWDKQIPIVSITNLYEESILEFARILKDTGVLCVLVAKPDLFIKYTKKYFPNKHITEYKLGLLGQTPTIILVN